MEYQRTSLANVQSIGDPAFAHTFDIFFPRIPGSNNIRNMTYKCQSTDLPGFGVQVGEAALAGVKVPYAGADNFEQSMSMTFLEEMSWQTRADFFAWKERTRSWANNSGSLASEYKVDPQIVLWNQEPKIQRICQLYGVFLETCSPVQLTGDNGSTIVTIQVTLRYTRHKDILVPGV